MDSFLPTDRKDEIGDLANSFKEMQHRLFTDRLTGIANREAVMRGIEDRIIRHLLDRIEDPVTGRVLLESCDVGPLGAWRTPDPMLWAALPAFWWGWAVAWALGVGFE